MRDIVSNKHFLTTKMDSIYITNKKERNICLRVGVKMDICDIIKH